MSDRRTITVRIRRFDPSKDGESHYRCYEMPFEDGMSVTYLLYRLNAVYGEAVAYRVACHRGLCASCLMRINGKPKLACCEPVVGDLTLEPAFPDKVIKDLVVIQH